MDDSALKAIPVHAVRDWGQRTGSRRVIVLSFGRGRYSLTTWGATRADCRLLAEWAESDDVPVIVGQIHAALAKAEGKS